MKDLVTEGKLSLLGVTQEQHAERCRLFAQWQQFAWPILHDPINLLQSKAVPIVVAIDEHGIVRSTKPTHTWVRDEFVTTKYSDDSDTAKAELSQTKSDQAILWNSTEPNVAVREYKEALQDDASGMAHFRLGVAYRARHDSSYRQPTDFDKAVRHWSEALRLDPNQYIWRRRIQQYGPRLKKPYPFYDWVEAARKDISERGEKPLPLRVALSGAEIASPSKDFVTSDEPASSPDPKNLITRDHGKYIATNIAIAPTYVKSGEHVRLHLEFAPANKSTKWNNEAEPLRVWIASTKSWTPQRSLLTYEGKPGSAESYEARKVEVEIQANAKAGKHSIKGFALYNVCEGNDGQCLMRRQDFEVPVFVE